MSETIIAGSERWSFEVERDWENGIINGCEADALERPFPIKIDLDEGLDTELNRLIDHGFNQGVAERMLGVEDNGGAKELDPVQQPAGQAHARPTRRKVKVRTPADARAADRLPDDQWMLR